MGNNKAGGAKYRETMIKKYGSLEAWKAVQRINSAKGGRASGTGGFGSEKVSLKDGLTGSQRAVLAGSIGGHVSRRKPKEL